MLLYDFERVFFARVKRPGDKRLTVVGKMRGEKAEPQPIEDQTCEAQN
jgi:hypothetical protein